MSGSSNFLVFNPTQANQETDAAYAADSQRASGAGTGSILPSQLANKLFNQTSVMVAALGLMLANKGYNVSDASESALAAVLANIQTNADLRSNMKVLTYSPAITCDVSQALGFFIPLSGNTSITFAGIIAGDKVSLFFQQVSGGNTIAFANNSAFGGVQPDPNIGSVSVQVFEANKDGVLFAVSPNTSSNGGAATLSKIDRTPIGSLSPSSGAFTSLTATTPTSTDNSTNAATTAWAKSGLIETIGATGSIRLPDWLGGLIVKWGTTSGLSGGGGSVGVSFATNFPTAAFGVVLSTIDLGGGDRISYWSGLSTSGFTAKNNGSNAEAFWIAIGN